MIGRWIIGTALLFGTLLLMLPKTDEQSLARIASASMLMCSKDFREQIAAQVRNGDPVAARFRNTCPDLIAGVELGEQGSMVINGKKYAIRMALKPVLEADRVRWSCRGEPATEVTRLCRP